MSAFRRATFSFLRSFSLRSLSHFRSSRPLLFSLAGLSLGFTLTPFTPLHASGLDYSSIRSSIAELLDDPDHDDGSKGPLFVRLAWHTSGTYDHNTKTGGSNGGTMRFEPECQWGANKGLELARKDLEKVKTMYPGISYGDLWTLAGSVAIEQMGGPKIAWRPGRVDAKDGKNIVPDGRLPDAAQGADHVRSIFGRMGFSDKEMVALIGAHCLGRCHVTSSGYSGPWTRAPTTVSNDYYRMLLNEQWSIRKGPGPKQYENKAGDLMMLPGDMCLLSDPKFRSYVELYANNEEAWMKDFGNAWTKLIELGVKF